MAGGWLQPDYLGAFLVGLVGGVHCLGMCGGIVSALAFSLPTNQRQEQGGLWPLLLAYNSGRILGYGLAGALVGGLGATALSFIHVEGLRQGMQVFAALFMMALGLYLAGIWRGGVAQVENAGRVLWRYMEPLGRRFMPVDSAFKALPLGFVWGWLPCGMVYSVLIWALTAGSALKGLLLMLAFGLGTLPNLLLMGTAALRLNHLTRNPALRRMAGALVSVLGIWLLWQALWPDGI